MDIIAFNEGSTANGRISKVNANPDSTSGIVTQPKVIATGETVTIPTGRMAVLPNIQIDGTLVVDGDMFIPSGTTTSDIENKLALKAPLASPTFTGTVVLPSTTSIGNVSNTELSYLDGVTSAIQTQLNTKAPLASPTFTGTPTVNNVPFSGHSGFKNYLINGNFDVWQRGTSFNYNNVYSADRWGHHQYQEGITSRVVSTLNNSVYAARISGNNTNSMRLSIAQGIEGINAKKLRGKTVTLSFYIRFSSSTVAGSSHFISTIGDRTSSEDANFNTSNYVESYTNSLLPSTSLPTVWTKYTITRTISSTANNVAVLFQFDNLLTNSIWYEIAQVQLEEGSVATPFENRPYGLELSLCQDYFKRMIGFSIGVYDVSYAFTAMTIEHGMAKTPTAVTKYSQSFVGHHSDAPQETYLSAASALFKWTGSSARDGSVIAYDYGFSAEL